MIDFKNKVVLTSDEAYFLGFFFADGCMSTRKNKNGNYQYFKIKLAIKDDQFLLDMQKKVGGTIQYPKVDLDRGEFPSVKLHNGDKNIVKFLQDFGFTTNKTYDQIDYLSKIPIHLQWHFIRGFFDGDGTVFLVRGEKRGGAFSIGGLNLPCLEACAKKISEVVGRRIHVKKVEVKGKGIGYLYRIDIRGNLVLAKIAEAMYENCGDSFMGRKKEIFDNLESSDGKNGCVGVSYHKQTNKWRAYLKNKHLGLFTQKEDAIKRVREEMGKSPFLFIKNANGHFINK